MVMDIRRTAFRSSMRFYRPISAMAFGTREQAAFQESPRVRVRWYRCSALAEHFPVPHAFSSLDWSTEEERYESEIGEVYGTNAWTSGIRPFMALGQRFCGTVFNWQNGFAWRTSLPVIPVNIAGLLACCGVIPAPPAGGMGLRAFLPDRSQLELLSLVPNRRKLEMVDVKAVPRGDFVLTGKDSTLCDTGTLPVQMLVQVTAPGYPFDGIVMRADASASWNNPVRVWFFSFTDGTRSYGINLLEDTSAVTFRLHFGYDNLTGNVWQAPWGSSATVPIPYTCVPFGFNFLTEGFLNGVDTGDQWRFTFIGD